MFSSSIFISSNLEPKEASASAEGSEPGEWGSQANRKCLRRSSHMSLAGADTQHPKCGWGPVDLTKLSPRRD